MKKTAAGSFMLSFLVNLLINVGGILPAVVFLILHFTVGFPLWPVFAALGVWVAGIIVNMLIVRIPSRSDPVLPNVNPYSSGKKPGTSANNTENCQQNGINRRY